MPYLPGAGREARQGHLRGPGGVRGTPAAPDPDGGDVNFPEPVRQWCDFCQAATKTWTDSRGIARCARHEPENPEPWESWDDDDDDY
jgi:hypothetical protein